MLVDVPLLLEDVVEIPDLDAPVDRRRDNTVVGADHQRLDLHNPLGKDGVAFEIFCKGTPESEQPFFSPDHQSSCPSRAVLV